MTQQLTPPDFSRHAPSDAPESLRYDGGFFVAETAPKPPGELPSHVPGSLALCHALAGLDDEPREYSFRPSRAYSGYLQMDKATATPNMVAQLEQIHDSLQSEEMPRYLITAGSAAVEAAMIGRDRPTEDRMHLLRRGAGCWQRAIETQMQMNYNGSDCLVEHSSPYRVALKLATLPLIEGIVQSDVSKPLREMALRDSLCVANANLDQMRHHSAEGNDDAYYDHLGLSFELISLIGFNRRLLPYRFMLPTSYRGDTGLHLKQQTHDMMIVYQWHGEVQSALPVEVKGRAIGKDRNRYMSLLVSGRDHLELRKFADHESTLAALTAVLGGTANPSQMARAKKLMECQVELARDYDSADVIPTASATQDSVMKFRGNDRARQRFSRVLAMA